MYAEIFCKVYYLKIAPDMNLKYTIWNYNELSAVMKHQQAVSFKVFKLLLYLAVSA